MESWTLPELVTEACVHVTRLPAPRNGQVRAVPDERTVRYYATLGLLDRPAAMRGRTALYDRRHLAQVVAIKRLQSAGRSLAEIQALWPTLDDASLARMTGIAVPHAAPPAAAATKREFWKRATHADGAAPVFGSPVPVPVPVSAPPPTIELRISLTDGATLLLSLPDTGVSLTEDDVRALRAAAQPLANELHNRRR